MHRVRWLLTCGWLLLIASFLYDPWSPELTRPDHPWSPLRISQACVRVQGHCLEPQQPYPLGTTVFWGIVIPAAVLILLVFGHELWRRICPLSFLSQIPRALGIERQIARVNAKTGQRRLQLAKVPADSWLARNHSRLQFAWLYVGLCGRILFFNADRLVLAGWMLFTIAAAVFVGWYYGGKSWCQYFCPMAPVQSVFSTPIGLLGSKAHVSEQPITQSMCRTVQPDGSEQSACVACQQPCIDIDAERTYWSRLTNKDFVFERYGYVGLVVGYFLYYYLYAGNWNYYYSGAWVRQSDQLAHLLSPAFYLFGVTIAMPRLVAVPLTLGLFTWLGLWVGHGCEALMRRRVRRSGLEPDRQIIRHRVFVLATWLAFNFFFLFSGRPILMLLPGWVQHGFDVLVVSVSALWLVRAWRRSPDLYSRENLAARFRKQLERLQLDVGSFLEGRSLSDLNAHEVYVLAKVLPGFTRQKRHEAYKGVVREALEEGYVNAASSLEVLQQMRRELGISDDEHRQLLDELGVEDPSLLDPDQRRSLEDQIRLSGFRKSLDRLLALQKRQAGGDESLAMAGVQLLSRRFSVSPAEEQSILGGLSSTAGAAQKAEVLLARLPQLIEAYRSLHQPGLKEHPFVLALLNDHLRYRTELAVRAILDCLVTLQNDAAVPALIASLQTVSPLILQEMLEQEAWSDRLPAEVVRALREPGETAAACSLRIPIRDTLAHLETLVGDPHPTASATALYLLTRLDRPRGLALAGQLLRDGAPQALLSRTATWLLEPASATPDLANLPELEVRVFLSTSDFFRRTYADTLEALAERAVVRRYQLGELITAAGDTCRELLLLLEGAAAVVRERDGERIGVDHLIPGQVLDELEVLTHSSLQTTIVAEAPDTRLLAIPVDSLDDMLDRDPDFARRVLELESRQLQRLTRS